jgi:succinoglycan biosynthesis transport protein ExoP
MKLKTDPSVLNRAQSMEESESALDILQILNRQRWIIAFCVALGLALGILYATRATVWYQSTAKVLINPKSPTQGSGNESGVLEEDILANHIEILRSRKIVEGALSKDGLMSLASIQPLLSESEGEDAADYVINQLKIVKGGTGAAKDARSLQIAFSHTSDEESRIILESVLVEYQHFITGQLESVMQKANEFINQAKDDVEADLRAVEQEYIAARKAAPLLFQGEGSSNVYQDKYRRLEEELLTVDIEESALSARLERVQETLETMEKDGSLTDHLDKLALIDSDSLQRLGLFASLQTNTAGTAEFQASQPARIAEAQTQYKNVLDLMREKQRLTTVFGPGHPKVQDIEDQINLVKTFLAENDDVIPADLGPGILNPELLLQAYVGFLLNDGAALRERKRELQILAKDAETQAKSLIDFELQDSVFRTKIARQEALFDGVVQQLRELDTASGLSGYVYELLETPRIGIKSWPSIPLCGLGGLMLGLFGGLVFAVANDLRDGRFRSAAELENFVKVPMLGRLGKVNSINRGIQGLIAAELTPDAEAIRMVRTFLLPDIRSGKLRTIGMSSPMQGDGKSTVVSNLAVSFSQLGLSVLAIDADLRRPSLHRYFSIKNDNGVSDLLSSEIEPFDAIQSSEIPNLSVLPAGKSTAVPAELLQSEKFDRLIELVKDRYDIVLVDLPPVLAVSDPLIVAPKLGGIVIVVRASTARRSEVMNSLSRLESAGGNIVGCIINSFGAGKNFSSDGGYFGYYDTSYTQSSSIPKHHEAGSNGKTSRITTAKPAGPVPTHESDPNRRL